MPRSDGRWSWLWNTLSGRRGRTQRGGRRVARRSPIRHSVELLEDRRMLSCDLGIMGASVFEGDGQANFLVRLSSVCYETVTVEYRTLDGTATAGTDYTATSGTLTFLAGAMEAALPISILNDTETEGDETFYVELANAVNATISASRAAGTIFASDAPPVLDPIGAQSVNEETQLAFTATAYDPDQPPDTLIFSLDAGAPAGAAIDSASGQFTWTPTEADGPGNYQVTVRVTKASAAHLTAAETITISVLEVNAAPTTTGIANVSVNEDAPNTVIDLFAAFDDTDDTDAQLTYQVVFNSDPGLFRSVSIDGTTGALTLAYAANAYGMADLTVRATDRAGLFVETTFTVNVAPVNDAPLLYDFVGIREPQEWWTFTGKVSDVDDDPTGWTVVFGGILASYGYTATVEADGTFTLTAHFPGLRDGDATAQTTDAHGAASNTATYYVVV